MIILKYIDELINKFKIDIDIILDKEIPLYECAFSNTIDFIIVKLSEPDFTMVEQCYHLIIANACVRKLIAYIDKSYSLNSLKKNVLQASFFSNLIQTRKVLHVLIDSDVSEQYKSGLNEDLRRLNSMINDITKSF